MKVLLIDDDCQMMRPCFRNLNAEMFFAESEKDGLRLLQEQGFDAILMDGHLCTERTGVDIVRDLRQSGLETKIIMFSSKDETNAEGIAAGANASFNKKMIYEKGWEGNLLKLLE